jgi:hypothetical protein
MQLSVPILPVASCQSGNTGVPYLARGITKIRVSFADGGDFRLEFARLTYEPKSCARGIEAFRQALVVAMMGIHHRHLAVRR